MAAEKFTRKCGLCQQELPAKINAGDKSMYVYVTCQRCLLMTVTDMVDVREEAP